MSDETDKLLRQLIDIENKTYFLLREMSFLLYRGTHERKEYFEELNARLCTATRKPKEKTQQKKETKKRTLLNKKH